MAIKTFTVTGLLTDGFVTLDLSDDIDLSVGKWKLCIKQIVFQNYKDQLPLTTSLCCNLVGDYRRKSSRKEFFYPPLCLFVFQEKNNFSISFDQMWFEINNTHKFIQIFCNDCFTETPLVMPITKLAVQILLQKIC